MQQSIGEYIRQARRQQNITQAELGEPRFSKSYVSAVERNKLVSSMDALRFFAERLGLSSDYFTTLLQQQEADRALSTFSLPAFQGDRRRDEALALLNVLLESTDIYNFPPHFELPAIAPELIAALPPLKQSRYYFLLGLVAKEKQDLPTTLGAFESALAFAPPGQDAAILDELGVYHYLRGAYQTALTYYLRALQALSDEAFSGTSPPGLALKIFSHAGDGYKALGEYEQACAYYEYAQIRLSSEHDMKTAGALYHALGYCTYAAIHQKTALSVHKDQRDSAEEEMEREFQRAIGLLVQSRNLYQVGSDRGGEADVRLTQTSALLDLCKRRRQIAASKSADLAKGLIANCASSLKEAEEQCLQVLLGWQGSANGTSVSPRLDIHIYTSLASLIRVSAQRASLGRLGGYVDTAFRERALATHLCQQVLNSLAEDSLPWELIQNIEMLRADSQLYQPPSLPRLPEMANRQRTFSHTIISQIEVYYAAGEVAEELGRVTPEKDYARTCYQRANFCYQASLALARLLLSEQAIEPDYIIRCHQRCICMLEERLLVASDTHTETTRVLLNILEDAFFELRGFGLCAERVAS